jgi:hypothetical protein
LKFTIYISNFLVSLSAITDAKVVCHLMQQLQVRSLEIVLEAKGENKKKTNSS